MTRRLTIQTACAFLLVVTSATGAAAAGGTPVRPAQRAPVVVQVRGDGFHWGDAAIGAGAALGLTLAAGGVVALAHPGPRPERKPHA